MNSETTGKSMAELEYESEILIQLWRQAVSRGYLAAVILIESARVEVHEAWLEQLMQSGGGCFG